MAHQALRVLALLALLHVCSAGFSCSGMGRRYCDEDASEADTCPETCLKKNCKKRKPVKLPQSGSYDYRSGFTYDDLVKKGLYQHVYISGERLCVGHCWNKPWKAKCRDRDGKACVELDCSHDKGNKYNSGNRFVGCHRDQEGNEKKPFHLPTCDECKTIFRKACKGKAWKRGVSADADVAGYVALNSTEDADDDEALTDSGKFVPFDSAPRGWQILFLDEYKDTDSMVVPVVNVILQFGNAIEDLDEQLVVDTLAEVAGVEKGQALLLHTYDLKEEYSRERFNTTSNLTETQNIVDYLLTVSVGIVTHDPESMAEEIRETGNEIWSKVFANAGNLTFLPRSLSAEMKHISADMVQGVVDSAEMVNATVLDADHMEPSSIEPAFEITSGAVMAASASTVDESGAFGIRSSAVAVASVAAAVIANFLL